MFGRQRISSVTFEQVEVCLAEMIGAGRAASTVHNHHVALNKVEGMTGIEPAPSVWKTLRVSLRA